jgi:hypothetical protein
MPPFCPVVGCSGRTDVAAHVQKEGDRIRSWYLAPVCRRHGFSFGGPFEYSDDQTLVPAAVGETCGRVPRDRPSMPL